MKVIRDPFDSSLILLAELLHPIASFLQRVLLRLRGEAQGQRQQQLGQLHQGGLPLHLQQQLEQPLGGQEHHQWPPQVSQGQGWLGEGSELRQEF